ncbi:MAG TPA: glycoside hydrolase [Clostridiaceae bacterium]|nr:glycoside hydrolase [Clostridiaceae bacterium]
MAKSYLNNAIIGNSRLLACLTDKGELIRFFWPNIDYQQHIENMYTGIFFIDRQSTTWLHETNWDHSQSYVEDTNIVRTLHKDGRNNLKVLQYDYALINRDIIIREYEIENTGIHEVNLAFILYSSATSTVYDLRSTLFDFDCDALIHYNHGHYISISADRIVWQFQLGNNAYENAGNGVLKGYDSIGMVPEGAMMWELGKFKPREKKKIIIFICAASTLKSVKTITRHIKSSNINHEYNDTVRYWHDYLKSARQICTGIESIDRLYKRSLLVFRLMADSRTGGILASAEIDEHFTKCGRYAYCWGRDAGFIASALDKCGLKEMVDKFYEWTANTQEDDGSWSQRYFMDGNLAPSWGLQIDETGTIIWGILQHYLQTGDAAFLTNMWNNVKKGVEFLIKFLDKSTGLPGPSYDLWEERFGVHAYSSAAVYAGICAGAEVAEILSIPGNNIEKWKKAAEELRNSIDKNLWSEDKGIFLRSILTKLNPWGYEPGNETKVIQVNQKGYKRDVTLTDNKADISLIGLAVPFGVYDVNDLKIKSTVRRIEERLTSYPTKGIKRYEEDNYIGGNPWVIATLWIALYYAKIKQYKKAKYYFDWAVKSCTEMGFLPEQVDRESGRPSWVIPLTWSHAMFILVLMELIDGEELKLWQS